MEIWIALLAGFAGGLLAHWTIKAIRMKVWIPKAVQEKRRDEEWRAFYEPIRKANFGTRDEQPHN